MQHKMSRRLVHLLSGGILSHFCSVTNFKTETMERSKDHMRVKGTGIRMVTLEKTRETQHLNLGKTFWQSLYYIPLAQEKHCL